MSIGRFVVQPVFVHLCLALVSLSSAQAPRDVAPKTERRTCNELRREMMSALQQIYEKIPEANTMKNLLPKWVELSLPVRCGKTGQEMTNFNPSSTKDNGGPLGALSRSGTIYTETQARGKRGIKEGNAQEESFRDKRAIETVRMDAAFREKRNALNNGDKYNGQLPLIRQRRFLIGGLAGGGTDFGAMSLGGPSAGPAQEVSESAQMMNNLLMLSRLQKSRLAQEYKTIGLGRSYGGDRVNFGTGIYGDTYHGRRKREIISPNEESGTFKLRRKQSRKKRFMFVGEPAEGTGPSPLLNFLFSGSLEPNTGKRSEVGGDLMKRVHSNVMLSFLPPWMQPPPGKEPGDYVKNMAPLFMSGVGSAGTVKRQNRNGFFGDALPGGKRRKRSSDDNKDADVLKFGEVYIPLDVFESTGDVAQQTPLPIHSPPPYHFNISPFLTPSSPPQLNFVTNPWRSSPTWLSHQMYTSRILPYLNTALPLFHGRRKKRSNDVVTIGDISIPMEFFKPPERSEKTNTKSESESESYPDHRPYYHSPTSQARPYHRHLTQNSHYTAHPYQPVVNQPTRGQYSDQVYIQNTNRVPHRHGSHNLVSYHNQQAPSAYTPQQSLVQPVPSSFLSQPVLFYQPLTYQNQPPINQPPPLVNQPLLLVNQPPSFKYQQTLPIYQPINVHQPPFSQPVPSFTNPYIPPQQPPPIDPFLPLEPHSPTRRYKRSVDSEAAGGNYLFTPPILSSPFSHFNSPIPYYSPIFPREPHKLGHHSPSGEIVYGDPLPWEHQSRPKLLSSGNSASYGHPTGKANNPTSPSLTKSSPSASPRQHNSPITGSLTRDLTTGGRFPSSTRSLSEIYSSLVTRPQFSPLLNTIGLGSFPVRGGFIYGDRLPW